MRIAVALYAIIGVCLIVFGCVLQNPPKGYAPGMFVAVGSLNLFAALAGFWGSYNKKRILLIFIVCGGLSTLLQIIFEITLQTAYDSIYNAIKDNSGDSGKPNLDKQLNIMRWVLIGFIFVELLTLTLACILKWVVKGADEYHGFDDDANEARQLNMGNLRSDLEANQNKNLTAYDKIKEKMSLKYGKVSGGGPRGQDPPSWKKKVELSFGNGRG